MTLGGLLEHLAVVEDEYFTRRLLGGGLGPRWDAVDWDADPDWEWRRAAPGRSHAGPGPGGPAHRSAFVNAAFFQWRATPLSPMMAAGPRGEGR